MYRLESIQQRGRYLGTKNSVVEVEEVELVS